MPRPAATEVDHILTDAPTLEDAPDAADVPTTDERGEPLTTGLAPAPAVPTSTPATIEQTSHVTDRVYAQLPKLRKIVPTSLDVDRFAELVASAVRATPDLMRCFASQTGERSVLLAALHAASIGLEPNTPLQDAWLLPRRNRDGVWEAQLSISARGWRKLAARSTGADIVADVVHEGDEFEWERTLEADILRHKPTGEGGPITHAYAIARFPDRPPVFLVMTWAQIEKRRAMSDSWKSETGRKFSPWTTWTEEMAAKTVIKALVTRRLTVEPMTQRALMFDDRTLDIDDDAIVVTNTEEVRDAAD